VNGEPLTDYSVLTLSVEGVFWDGATAEAYVSEQIKPDVSGAVVFDYNDYLATVENSARMIVEGETYTVIYVENIARQNEVMFVAVKK
jgi:hypothetical protein